MNDLSVITSEFGDISRWQDAPEFWVSKPERAAPLIDSLKQAAVHTIGRSAGGREIIAIEYGEKEPLETTTDCLSSALASSLVPPDPTDIFPPAFFGAKRRRKPVLAIQGGIHGGELTGTVAALNLCRIIETGEDLRGRPWPRLQELAAQTRIAVIPWLNIDGVTRFPLVTEVGAPGDLTQRCQQGVALDGTKYKYPKVKNIFPIPPDRTAFMGAYYNDAGVNLQYDFCMPRRQPETVAWMEYYLQERPDAALICHCNAGSMMGSPEAYLPEGHQHELSRLGGAVRQRLLREGHEIGRLSWAGLVAMGKHIINQINAVYHVCGAMPILCEFPSGNDLRYMDHHELLDIGLITLEEILFYAHRDGLRPYELWEKVRKSLQ